MWAEIVHDMVERYAQMLHERHLRSRLIVKRHRLIENGEVSCLLDVGHGSEYQPHRVVIEASADTVVSALCQRLVLMVTSSVRELCRSYVYDTLAGSFRYEMHEADKVLIGVTEAHSAADSAFEERCRTRHVERHHALILIPDVDHPVHLLLTASDGKDIQQSIPISLELIECCIYLG